MIEGRFNIVFAGRLAPGKSEAEVKQNLARLFKTSVEQMDRLFAGSEITLKKNLEYAQAMKYQSALKQAGALALIQKVEGEAAKLPEPAKSKSPELADANKVPEVSSAKVQQPEPTAKEQAPSDDGEGDWTVAAPGERLPETEKLPPIPEPDLSELSVGSPGEVLAESQPKPKAEVDTSGLSLDELSPMPASEPKPAPEVDLSGLSVAAPGEKIPNAPDEKPKVNPDTSHLSLD